MLATLSIKDVNSLNEAIEKAISEASGSEFVLSDSSGLGGGCINDASRITGRDGRMFFAKLNSRKFLTAFEAEAYALSVMAKTRTIKVPVPVVACSTKDQSALILEYLPMGRSTGSDWSRMGAEFARLHRHTGEKHGWPHDNWIGSSPQLNKEHDDWISFYRECRLLPQVKWARNKHLMLRDADTLMDRLADFFEGYRPGPSLLHGDLWSGNAGFLDDGTPVIFDPAAYYGDREADLAMTEMFGGYPPDFYRGYNAEWQLDSGYRVRKHLYILYHTLNHYNIFGGGYGSQAESIIRSLLRS